MLQGAGASNRSILRFCQSWKQEDNETCQLSFGRERSEEVVDQSRFCSSRERHLESID